LDVGCGLNAIRWAIWDVEEIEPWYRQNIFTAKRVPDLAWEEVRIIGILIFPNKSGRIVSITLKMGRDQLYGICH
jgi:hypothetical protein